LKEGETVLCTEEEAKEKVCKIHPGAVIQGTGAIATQQGVMQFAFAKCSGSACMHFRWWGGGYDPAIGYCGLAGIPHDA